MKENTIQFGKFQIEIYPTTNEDGSIDSNSIGMTITTKEDSPLGEARMDGCFHYNHIRNVWIINGPY